jgi:hypothetical protein
LAAFSLMIIKRGISGVYNDTKAARFHVNSSSVQYYYCNFFFPCTGPQIPGPQIPGPQIQELRRQTPR